MPHKLSEDLTLEYMILCEDIREELGNKHSLMGVVNGDINVPSFPAQFRAAFFGALKWKSSGSISIAVRVSLDETVLAEAKSEFTFDSPGTSNFIIPTGVVHVAKPSRLSLFVSLDRATWTNVNSKTISTVAPKLV